MTYFKSLADVEVEPPDYRLLTSVEMWCVSGSAIYCRAGGATVVVAKIPMLSES